MSTKKGMSTTKTSSKNTPSLKRKMVKKKVSGSKVKMSVTKNNQPKPQKAIVQRRTTNSIDSDSNKFRLQKTLISAAKEAFKESKISGDQFKEEALRYIVMNKISNQRIWGEFPNLKKNKKRIYFNLNYKPLKSSNKKTEYPDIGICTVDKEDTIISYDIAIELKIKFEDEPIAKDLKKLFHYIHPNKGKIEYGIGAFVVVPKTNMSGNDFSIFLKKMNNIKREFSRKLNESNANIFFCWIDLKGKEDYFWITYEEHLKLMSLLKKFTVDDI